VLLVLVLVVGLAAVAAVAVKLSSSSSHPASSARDADAEGADAGEVPNGYLDLKATSGKTVTRAQVKRAGQQAALIPTGDPAAWQFVGPTNVGGRVVDLAIDPTTSPSTVFAAVSSGGGVMKSTDGGVTFTPAYPNSFDQNMGALARASNGTLYAGTGEANPSGGGQTHFGDGLYRSTDDGQTWQPDGLGDSGAIGRIAVNPQNPNEVFVAATGSLQWVSGQRGLYRSTDGGNTWQLVLPPTNDKTGAVDVAVDPQNPNVVLASLWDRYRNSGAFFYGGAGSGLYRSTDGGSTWTRLDNSNIAGSVCPWDPDGTGLDSSASLGRIGIAFAPSDGNRVYIQSSGAFGPDKGFYVSNDAGQTWTCSAGEPGDPNAGYEWVFGRLWVDPADENHVFAADISLRESFDGGATWHNSSGPHADQHAMAWDPNTPNLVYLGDDGGVYRSPANGATRTWTHATVEPWNQAYHISVSQQDPQRLVAGFQDQGSVRTWRPGVEPTDLTQWNSYGGGDGHWVQIDPADQLTYYQCSQPGPPSIFCGRRVDAAATGSTASTGTSFSSPPWPSNTRITTDMPLTIDPADHHVVYVAGTSIARSGDGVVSGSGAWTIISPTTPDSAESLPGPVPSGEINQDTTYANEYGTVSQIAPAKSTGTATTPASTIYAGTDTGLVWKTTNATADPASNVTWTRLGQGVLPQAWVNAIVVDPTDANHVFVAFSGYREGDNAANVWETKDGGATWKNLSGNLPNAPIWMLTYDKANNVLYAGSSFGAYYHYEGAGTTWLGLGSGLPACPTFDLKLSADGTLFASAYGRGIWQMPEAPALSFAILKGFVGQFSTSADVTAGLDAKLDAAASANGKSRARILTAFQNQVRDATGTALTAEQAAILIDLAEALK
jgi:photosystem II stability/assembly factor-like uncharacterized protein